MVFIWMILKKGPLFAGMTTYVVPVLALLWGTLDHETISTQQMLAIGGVLAMVALVQTGSRAAAVAPTRKLPRFVAAAARLNRRLQLFRRRSLLLRIRSSPSPNRKSPK